MDLIRTLNELRSFSQIEHEANQTKLYEVWRKPLPSKLKSGESQLISEIKLDDKNHLVLILGEGDSCFREGDMICLHQGDPKESTFVRQAIIEAENEGEWLVRTFNQNLNTLDITFGEIYADPDNMDLKPFYDKALDEIANSRIGTTVILPLLAGDLDTSFIYTENYEDAADYAEEKGLNSSQIDGWAKVLRPNLLDHYKPNFL